MAKPIQGNRKVNPFRRIEMITLEAPPHPTSCHVGNVTYIYELRATNYEVPEAERSEAEWDQLPATSYQLPSNPFQLSAL